MNVSAERKPSIALAIIRVIVITTGVTLLSSMAALFFGILVISLLYAVHGGAVDITRAYSHAALPGAIAGFAAGFVTAVILEIREHRRQRTANEYSRAG